MEDYWLGHATERIFLPLLKLTLPERDVGFRIGPIDVLDHSSRGFTFGSKMGIDATRKWKEEGFTREWPNRIVMDPETKQKIDAMWGELGIDLGGNGR